MIFIIPDAQFKHIAILVPAVAKSFHANADGRKRNKNGAQQHLYAMPFGTLRIAKPLCGILKKRAHAQIAHLVFCRHESQTQKKPKELFFASARTTNKFAPLNKKDKDD